MIRKLFVHYYSRNGKIFTCSKSTEHVYIINKLHLTIDRFVFYWGKLLLFGLINPHQLTLLFSFSSESVKQRSNVFYLLPERCCVPNSPLWFSTTPLDDSTMEAMLIRILSVRDLHVRTSKLGQRNPSDNSQYIPEDDRDSE